MGNKHSKRLASLDIVRIFALALVFLVHCIENTWDIGDGALRNMSTMSSLVVLTLYTLGRLSVPLFLFLTGYLMLDREYRKESIASFYKKKVLKLVVVTWFWYVVYILFTVIALGRTYCVADIVKLMLFVSPDSPNAHMWYMSTIIGIYIFLPFVANAIKLVSKRVGVFIMMLLLVFWFIVPTINSVLAALKMELLAGGNLDIAYVGGYCGFYLIMGYVIKKYGRKLLERVRMRGAVVIMILSIVASVALHYVLNVKLGQFSYAPWYDSIFILIASCCLFAIMINVLKDVKPNCDLSLAASMVFGVYLTQQLFIYIFVDKLGKFGLVGWRCYLAMMIFVVPCSILTIVVLRKLLPKYASWIGAKT